MARMAEMYPDLMFASRQQSNAHEGGSLPEPSFDPDSGFGSLAVRVDDHAGFLAAQRRIQDLRVRRPGSGDDGQIVAFDLVLPLAQEFVEVAQHRRGLRQRQQAGRATVEAVAELQFGQFGPEMSERFDHP